MKRRGKLQEALFSDPQPAMLLRRNLDSSYDGKYVSDCYLCLVSETHESQ